MGLRTAGVGSMPGANQEIQQGLEEAKKTELISAIGTAAQKPVEKVPVDSFQQMGREAQQQVTQTGQQLKEQSIKQAAGQQEQQMQVTKVQQLKRIQETQLKLDDTSRTNEQTLGNISSNIKTELFDNATTFQRDELNRALFNEYQLHDWAVTQAVSEEEYASYEQTMLQESEKQMKLYDASLNQIKQALTQEYAKEQQQQDQQLKRELIIAKNALEKKIQKAKANAANRAARWAMGGAIIGTAIGAVAGSFVPGGTVIGAAVGGQLGQAAGGALGNS